MTPKKNQLDTLSYIDLPEQTLISGKKCKLQLSYQLFGCELHSAPIVMVNHALTGNSNVCGDNGWWSSLIGPNKTIDSERYTIFAFNIPGNGYDGNPNNLIENYQDFVARDIANIFLMGLKSLKINKLFAIIGGSLGGGIAWEMAVLDPKITKHLIPIATDWKSTDWVIANCLVQEQFLNNSKNPLCDARMHAMLCYRTPASFEARFDRSKTQDLQLFNIESWLLHHGEKLQVRFQLSAYKLMNQLLRTIDISSLNVAVSTTLNSIESEIVMIGIDSDLFFVSNQNRQTLNYFKPNISKVSYSEISSVHGHDAFLIEYDQLSKIVAPLFQRQKNAVEF